MDWKLHKYFFQYFFSPFFDASGKLSVNWSWVFPVYHMKGKSWMEFGISFPPDHLGHGNFFLRADLVKNRVLWCLSKWTFPPPCVGSTRGFNCFNLLWEPDWAPEGTCLKIVSHPPHTHQWQGSCGIFNSLTCPHECLCTNTSSFYGPGSCGFISNKPWLPVLTCLFSLGAAVSLVTSLLLLDPRVNFSVSSAFYFSGQKGKFQAPSGRTRSQKMKVKISQLCQTLCNNMDRSLPNSSVHGILQARILEWVTIPFYRRSSRPGIPGLSHCRWILYCLCHEESPRIPSG